MPYLIKMFFYLQIKLYQSRNPNCFKCNDVKTIRKKRHLGMTLRAKKKKNSRESKLQQYHKHRYNY